MWRRRIFRYILPAIFFIFACAFQTTAWPAIMGSFTAPPIWLLVLAWLSIYRPGNDTILFLYALGLLAIAFTSMPLKVMLWLILLIHILVTIARSRVFWPGSGYFMMMSAVTVALYQVLSIALSRFLEPTMSAWMITDRLLQVLLAIPFSVVVYFCMNFLERPFANDALAEGSGQA